MKLRKTKLRENELREIKLRRYQGRFPSRLPAVAAIAAIAASAISAASATTTAAVTAAPAPPTPASTTAAPAVPTATAAATTSLGLRLGFINHQVAPPQVLTVEGIDSFLRVFITGDFDEGEPPRLAGETVTNQGYS
jgi:hypothetical protein